MLKFGSAAKGQAKIENMEKLPFPSTILGLNIPVLKYLLQHTPYNQP